MAVAKNGNGSEKNGNGKLASNGHRNDNGSQQVLPWVFAGIGMVGAVVVFVWGQINPKVDIGNVEGRLNERITQLEARLGESGNVLRKEVQEVRGLLDGRLSLREHAEYVLRKDKETERQDEMLRMLAQSRVTRGEYDRELMNISDRLGALRVVVDKLQADLSGSYNVGKQLDNLQAQQVKQAEITAVQIQELRRSLDARAPLLIKPSN